MQWPNWLRLFSPRPPALAGERSLQWFYALEILHHAYNYLSVRGRLTEEASNILLTAISDLNDEVVGKTRRKDRW